jgi:hypothetical protein
LQIAIVAASLLGVSAVAYVAAVVLIGVVLASLV